MDKKSRKIGKTCNCHHFLDFLEFFFFFFSETLFSWKSGNLGIWESGQLPPSVLPLGQTTGWLAVPLLEPNRHQA